MPILFVVVVFFGYQCVGKLCNWISDVKRFNVKIQKKIKPLPFACRNQLIFSSWFCEFFFLGPTHRKSLINKIATHRECFPVAKHARNVPKLGKKRITCWIMLICNEIYEIFFFEPYLSFFFLWTVFKFFCLVSAAHECVSLSALFVSLLSGFWQ